MDSRRITTSAKMSLSRKDAVFFVNWKLQEIKIPDNKNSIIWTTNLPLKMWIRKSKVQTLEKEKHDLGEKLIFNYTGILGFIPALKM